jgi:hypothetical protein
VSDTSRDSFRFSSDDQIDRMIAGFATMGASHHVELLRAVRQRQINLLGLGRAEEAPMKVLESSLRPTIVLIGDDDYQTTGPTGWASFRRLGYWANGALVHATGADVASYRLGIGMAIMHRRFLFVETSSKHADEWAAALRKRSIATFGLLPPGGASHPVLPPRGAMQ